LTILLHELIFFVKKVEFMKGKRRQIIYKYLIFISVLIISGFFFYISNKKKIEYTLSGYRNTITLVTQKEAELIHEKYLSGHALSPKIAEIDEQMLNGVLESVQETYPFFNSIELVTDPIIFFHQNYLILSENNKLYFYFKVGEFCSECNRYTYIKVGFDIEKLFSELQVSDKFNLSNSKKSILFVYGLSVEPVGFPLTLTQIILMLIHGAVILFIIRRFSYHYHSYYYNSEGLEKIIYLFEKTEEYSANHSRNVAEISYFLAKKYGLKRKRLKDLKVAAFLHDIGKISIPVEILNKNGALNKDEFGEIKKHVIFSAEIIENFESLKHLKEIILYHHEKMDGSGYPVGLSGDQIPIESRIISVADVFEALVGQRPYRAPIERDEAIRIMDQMPIDREIFSILTDNLEEICKLITYRKGYLRKRAMNI